MVFVQKERKTANFGADWLSSEEKRAIEFTVYVRKEGRMTVPKVVRDALDIKEGSLVRCIISKVKKG